VVLKPSIKAIFNFSQATYSNYLTLKIATIKIKGACFVWHLWQLCSSGHPYHTDGLTCLALSSDSTLAITGSKDNSVHIVNITSGRVCFFLHSYNYVCNFGYIIELCLFNCRTFGISAFGFFDMMCIGMLLFRPFWLLRYLDCHIHYSESHDRKHDS
jgi:hypothetical protein